MKTELRTLSLNNIDTIKEFFVGDFSKKPWNDDWSNKEQLHSYITDLIGNSNSLSLGFYCDGEMTGLAMGNIKHW